MEERSMTDDERAAIADGFWRGLAFRGRKLGWNDMTADEQASATAAFHARRAQAAPMQRRSLELGEALPLLLGHDCQGAGIVTRDYLNENGIATDAQFLVEIHCHNGRTVRVHVRSLASLHGLLDALQPAEIGVSHGAREDHATVWKCIRGRDA
jgi:hypothetical protein